MKKLKNAMLLAASGLLVTALVTTSCSKDDNPPSGTAPTITTVNPEHGPVGASVAITGANLSGATVKFNDVDATVSGGTSTLINVTVPEVPVGAATIKVTTSAGTVSHAFTVDAPALSSDDVAKESLVAHWRFNDTKKEDSSNADVESATGATTFIAGKIGKGLQFTNAYLIYPIFDKFNNDPTLLADGFTISFWGKIPVNTKYTSIVQLNGNIGDIFGLIGLAHRKNPDAANPGNGIFDFDGTLTHVNGDGTHSLAFAGALEGTSVEGFGSFADTAWTFITMTYSDATRKITYYGNGIKVGEKEVPTSVIPADQKLELVTTASSATSTSKFSFGSLNTNPPFAVGNPVADWQGANFTGALDDVRIFKKALSQAEVTDLYSRGSAGN